jgi:hypothetical protein
MMVMVMKKTKGISEVMTTIKVLRILNNPYPKIHLAKVIKKAMTRKRRMLRVVPQSEYLLESSHLSQQKSLFQKNLNQFLKVKRMKVTTVALLAFFRTMSPKNKKNHQFH